MRRITARTGGRAGRAAAIAAVAIALPGCLAATGPTATSSAATRSATPGAATTGSPATGATWFTQAADIPTLTPATNRQGDPTGGPPRNIGGEAAAVFDVNHDGVPDIVFVNGTSYYFVSDRKSVV